MDGGANGGGRAGRGGANSGTPATPQPLPVDETINFLAANYGLHNPQWAAWRARMRSPKLAGRWLVSAYIAGRGKYFGDMTMENGAADDEFTTRVTLRSVED